MLDSPRGADRAATDKAVGLGNLCGRKLRFFPHFRRQSGLNREEKNFFFEAIDAPARADIFTYPWTALPESNFGQQASGDFCSLFDNLVETSEFF